ncbi:SemiSWEET transporter [Prochlorococcus sp. MIT 1307]|uniref:SemiSWEET transporter n=1 Tax=Prochlorococcus sp. MIT 1307 TaxID=3096219 RepID=UPI002A753D25|nr:SemiSWEET transporter [Prochlorococcus sp. MIT 1307]
MIDIINKAELYGYIAALLTTIAFLPQLIRTFRTKSADDVSLLMLVIFIIGLLFWILYGWQSKAFPVLIANLVTLILNCSILLLKLVYRTRA